LLKRNAKSIPMAEPKRLIQDVEYAELDSFLADRIYEFNSQSTSIFDGETFAAAIQNSSGKVIAGISGHTWGGTCQINHLWVHPDYRKAGLGTALMDRAESEAKARHCTQIILSTHSFQAPGFYQQLGYAIQAEIREYPAGHSNLHLIKRLKSPDAT
jgi:ribosomal protein S18 acetylase RimI-like enzyme